MTRKRDRPKPAEVSPSSGKLALVLKVVAGITAVLSLVFGIRQAAIYVADHRERQHRVGELLAAAELQQRSRDYRGAWSSLGEAASIGARDDVVQKSREDLAMVWLENARSSQGMTLGTIGDTLAPVLSRGVIKARGARKADLLAHHGWADFLRWRDGQRQLDPAARYREALAVDPSNVYAHAMLGHWLLWRNSDSLAEANRHFAAALESGRERPFARQLQLAALGDKYSDDNAQLELLRVANDMRTSNEPVDAKDRDRLWDVYYSVLRTGGSHPDSNQLVAVVRPTDLLLTYRWLFATSEYPKSKELLYTYQLARLEEAAGNHAQALASYRAARARAIARSEPYVVPIDAGIARLSRQR